VRCGTGPGPDHRGRSRRCSFAGCWFEFRDFGGADPRGASLRGIRWAGCALRGADRRDTDLTGARFEGAVLRDVQAEGVIGTYGPVLSRRS
jgi:uncharacterized protein YjbI with pentapeptide repeats